MGSRRYVKKPEVVEAIQFDGRNHRAVEEFVDLLIEVQREPEGDRMNLLFRLIDGVVRVEPGTWIVKAPGQPVFALTDENFTRLYVSGEGSADAEVG